VIPPREWSDSDNALLDRLWRDGVFLAEIARTFHCSRVAVRRQVRVLGLANRSNPAQSSSLPKRAKPVPHGASTLPPLPSQLEDV